METTNERTLAATIHRLAAWQTATMNRYLRTLALNNDQANVIHYVGAHPGVNQRTVADLLSRNVASMTNLLKSLEGRNLLERRFEGTDERTKHLYLTPHGQTVDQEITRGFGTLNQRVDGALTDAQREAALNALDQLVTTLLPSDKGDL
ncbi:MarR family winged helix-turn-helix transcriptional regulator [Furfurilactobacillus sp. WILCCON 0119]